MLEKNCGHFQDGKLFLKLHMEWTADLNQGVDHGSRFCSLILIRAFSSPLGAGQAASCALQGLMRQPAPGLLQRRASLCVELLPPQGRPSIIQLQRQATCVVTGSLRRCHELKSCAMDQAA